jgi:hypothetical protein
MSASINTSESGHSAIEAPALHTSATNSLISQAIDGVLGNALTISKFSRASLVEGDPVGTLMALRGMVKAAQDGDLSQPEAILMSQALSLDAIFGNLARRAAGSISTDLDRSDRLLRLALKAQAQSRASLETLITAKNPPVVFARQANIAAGHQQVNNGGAADRSSNKSVPERPRAADSASAPIEVLEEATHGERTDGGASFEAIRGNQGVGPLEQVDGAAHRCREGAQERRSRRAPTADARAGVDGARTDQGCRRASTGSRA